MRRLVALPPGAYIYSISDYRARETVGGNKAWIIELRLGNTDREDIWWAVDSPTSQWMWNGITAVFNDLPGEMQGKHYIFITRTNQQAPGGLVGRIQTLLVCPIAEIRANDAPGTNGWLQINKPYRTREDHGLQR